METISGNAQWIWTAANFDGVDALYENDSVFIKTTYNLPASSCPPSATAGYVTCCSCNDPANDCTSCEITTWFKKQLQVPADVDNVWLKYSYDDEALVYVNGAEVSHDYCCSNPKNLDLTPYIVKGSQNLVTVKLRVSCSCGYFGGEITYGY